MKEFLYDQKFKITYEMYLELYQKYVYKILRRICSIGLIIDLICLVINIFMRIKGSNNIVGIILIVINLLLFIILKDCHPAFKASYQYNLLKDKTQGIKYNYNSIVVYNKDVEKEIKYENIDKIFVYDIIAVIKTKDKIKQYYFIPVEIINNTLLSKLIEEENEDEES